MLEEFGTIIAQCAIWCISEEDDMKKVVLITLCFAGVVWLACPGSGYAHGGSYYGWYVPGAFLGGMLFGAAISRPYPAPPPAYGYPAPAPAYAYPAPVYAYPYYGPRYYWGPRYYGGYGYRGGYYGGRGYYWHR